MLCRIWQCSEIQNGTNARGEESMMNALIMLWISGVLPFVMAGQQPAAAQAASGTIEKGDFRFTYDERGISGLANPNDPFGATLIPAGTQGGGRGQSGAAGRGGGAGATLGLNLSYRVGSGEWATLATRGAKWTASAENGTVVYVNDMAKDPLKVVETYKTDGTVLD
jgi:hypothetical protein